MMFKAGANMLPDIRVTSPPIEVNKVMAHFRCNAQFSGLAGSSGPSQLT